MNFKGLAGEARVYCYLPSGWRQLAFLLVLALIAVGLGGGAAYVGLTTVWGQSLEPQRVQAASRIDPSNPAIHHWLGRLYNFEELDAAKAIPELRRAIELNGRRPAYWSDLGWACFGAGDLQCARESFANSVRLAPMVPHYEWEFANYLVLSGQKDQALAHLQRFLVLGKEDPSSATAAFQVYMRAFDDADSMWDMLARIPDSAALQLAYLDFLAHAGNMVFADKYWGRLAAVGGRLEFDGAADYLHQLLLAGNFPQAVQVWHDLQQLGSIPANTPGNAVFNGNFERDPLRTGFDWASIPGPYLFVDFADRAGAHGQRCLRVDYTVADNSESQPVEQLVPVLPGQTYVLSANVRSNEIRSDSGPRLRVIDVECRACLEISTDGTTGTTPWHQISSTFTTGPQTKLVRLSIWRPRSRSFPMEITGQFWVDAVSLGPAEAAVQSAATPTKQ